MLLQKVQRNLLCSHGGKEHRVSYQPLVQPIRGQSALSGQVKSSYESTTPRGEGEEVNLRIPRVSCSTETFDVQ